MYVVEFIRFLALSCGISLVITLLIPRDPSNAFLLGYSPARWVMIAGFVLVLGALAAAHYALRRRPALEQGVGKTAIHVDEITPSTYTEKKELGPVEQAIPQTSVLFIFLFPLFMVAGVREEQSNGLFRRLLTTPASRTDLVAGKLVWGVMICTIQMAIIFGLGLLASNFKGHRVLLDIPGFLLLTLALAGASTSLGLLIASTRLPAMIALAPMLLGGVLGGAIIFADILPAFIQPVSFLMPQRYGVDGYVDLIGRGGDLITVLPEAAFLLLFTVFFTVIAIWLMYRVFKSAFIFRSWHNIPIIHRDNNLIVCITSGSGKAGDTQSYEYQ